jgi:fructose-specific phosphotransferase system IIC component
MFFGMLCSILGGFVAARIAKRGALLNGALSAFLCVGFGVYALVSKTNTVSPWMHAAGFLLSPALGALGGYLWEWRRTTKRMTPAAA